MAGTAKTVDTAIIGMTFLGIAAASQQVSAAATAEIFPMKWRGYVQGKQQRYLGQTNSKPI